MTWRAGSGRAVVLLDRCPHRGLALSLGNSTGDGALAFAFHGHRELAGTDEPDPASRD